MDDLKSDFQYSGMVDREIEEYGKSQIMPPNVKREIAERESREREEKKARTELDQQTARDVELTKRRKETTGETVGAYIGGRWEVPPTPPTPELTAQEKVAQGAPEGYETYYNVEKQRYEARPPGEAKAIPPEEVIQPRAGREFIPAIPKGQREVEIAPTPPALEVGNESWKLFANINPVKAEASLYDMYSSIQKRDIAIARVDTLNAAEVKDKGAIVEAEEEVSTAQIEFDAKSRASGITEAELMQYLRKKAGMPEPPPTPGKPPEMSDEEWNLRQNVTLENLAETQAELAKIQLVAPVATEPTREELEAEMRRRGLL